MPIFIDLIDVRALRIYTAEMRCCTRANASVSDKDRD
jgi:hypothetical protein